MNCNVVKDLIPLYIDGCCSEESKKIVNEHIQDCDSCKNLFEEMKTPSDFFLVSKAPNKLSKIHDWSASLLQSVLLFISFALITVGVAFEAQIPSGFTNGLFAANLVVPTTGFMLSLANWYFIRVYKSRKRFSNYSMIATLVITICAYIWSGFHYNINLLELCAGQSFAIILERLHAIMLLNINGICLTVLFCTLSKILSNQYAKMLGKE